MADQIKTLNQFLRDGGKLLWDDAGDGSHAPVVSATFAGSIDTEFPAAAAAADNTANPTTTSVLAFGMVFDGATWDRQPGTSADGTLVNLGSNNDVVPSASASGLGASIFRSIDLDETEEEVKATAGQVYGVIFSNTATTSRFLKFYNATAATVVVGTTTPVMTVVLPGNASDDVSGVIPFPVGVVFDTAITVAATTAIADNDTGAPGANEVVCNVLYK